MKSIAYLGLFLCSALSAQTATERAGALPVSFLPGDDAIAAEAGDQLSPAVAAGGGVLLTAWTDERSYPSVVSSLYNEFETSSDVFGMRLDANGVPIDAVPFPITQKRGAQGSPQISWNGTHWLVAYESTDLHGTGYYYQKSLEAVRIAPTGQVLDATPIKLRNVVPVGSFSWALASDGQDWAVAFQSSDSSSALKALRVSASGIVAMPPKFLVPSTYFLRSNARLAWAGGVYLYTWQEFSDTKALRLDANLNPLDASPIDLLPGRAIVGLASDGTQFYAVWVQQVLPTYVVTVLGSRIDTAGTLLDGNGVNISAGNAPQAYTKTAVAWDGTDFRVTWASGGAVSVARVNPSGAVLDPGGVSVTGPTAGATAGLPGGGVLTSWSPYASGEYDVIAAAIPPTNVAGPSTTLSTGSPMQFRPDAAAGTAGFMLVFRSDVAGTNRILAQPLGLDGSPLTTAPVLLASGPRTGGPGTPSIAWNGSLYMASWSQPSGIVAQRLNQDGSLVDPAPFQVTSGFGRTDVAALENTFLVLGRRFGFSTQYINTIAARVRGNDGVVLDPGGLVIGASYVTGVATTAFGARWLAVWRANFTHDDPVGATYGTFVQGDGTFGPQFRISNYSSSSGGNGIFEVAVASDGVSALVLQSAELSSGVETDLTAVMVGATGSTGPQVNLTPWDGNQYAPRAAFDGTEYVVAFNEQKTRFAPWTLDQLDARGDLFGMRLAVDGTKVDPTGFAFSLSPTAETHPNVAAASGLTLITGAILRGAPYESYRVGYRLLGAGANRWPVAVASADRSGGDVPLTVGFDSTGSHDPDGASLTYAWDFGDGAGSTLPNPLHTYTVPGENVVTLTVTDANGAPSTNAVRIDVTAPNAPPVAVATATPTRGRAPLSVTLFGERSFDPDGALGNFQWSFSDGGTYWGSTAYHTFSQPGRHTATLTVYDSRGGLGTTEVVFLVSGNRMSYARDKL